MSRYLPPFLTELWCAVTRIGKPQHIADYRHDASIRNICREHHSHLRAGLERLAEEGYLRRASGGTQIHARYWWTSECRIPGGCFAPGAAQPAGVELATARRHVNAVMPIDRTPLMAPMGGPAFDFAQHPSRRGDRLHYRDGRVTDLKGNPA